MKHKTHPWKSEITAAKLAKQKRESERVKKQPKAPKK